MVTETLLAVIVFGLLGATSVAGYVISSRNSDRNERRNDQGLRHSEARRTS
jgi:hypothetical protein